MNGNTFQGPSIMPCSPQPTTLSRFKEFCGHVCFFLLEPIHVCTSECSGGGAGVAFLGTAPPISPLRSWPWCRLTVDPREGGSEDSNAITTLRPCAESFRRSIMFVPRDPSTRLGGEPCWWPRPLWGWHPPSVQH